MSRVRNVLAKPRSTRHGVVVLIRRELPDDVQAVAAVHAAAFAPADGSPAIEVELLEALRADPGWVPELSLVACTPEGRVVGHVVATRGAVGETSALGIGPLGVLPAHQREGVGAALMHTLLGAADALGAPVAVLLGHLGYYPRFGFVPASELGIESPDPVWGEHFQARALAAWTPALVGPFRYARPFDDL